MVVKWWRCLQEEIPEVSSQQELIVRINGPTHQTDSFYRQSFCPSSYLISAVFGVYTPGLKPPT